MNPKDLTNSDYSEDSDYTDDLGSNHVMEKKDCSEESDDAESDDSDDAESYHVKHSSEDSDESESDSDSDDSTVEKDEEFDHQWEELRNEAPDTDEITKRIAVCNMDWDRIRAVDLLVCFNSFKPEDGNINSVKIYPSEFGLKRMEEEKLKGPSELVEETLPINEDEPEEKKGSKFHREKLRQYQINRLKYYYAVVDCDSPETANKLYDSLNGMEYESSSIRFDLRFIPDDLTFDHEPTSSADKVPEEYKPRLFVTSALQQVKVDLTWDETAPKRREFFQKIFTNMESVENDIHDFLASASSESEEEVDTADDESDKKLRTKDRIAKYKELLKSLEEKEKQEEKYDVEVTWDPALKEKTEEKVKEKKRNDSLNPFDEMLLRKRDQKKIKKKELKNQKQSEDSDDSEEETSETVSNDKDKTKNNKLAELALISNYEKETESEDKLKKKKGKSEELDGFVPDMNDPRFSAMYTSSLFNMVPSDKHPKKNSGNFGAKRKKERKFKSSKNHELHKKARYC